MDKTNAPIYKHQRKQPGNYTAIRANAEMAACHEAEYAKHPKRKGAKKTEKTAIQFCLGSRLSHLRPFGRSDDNVSCLVSPYSTNHRSSAGTDFPASFAAAARRRRVPSARCSAIRSGNCFGLAMTVYTLPPYRLTSRECAGTVNAVPEMPPVQMFGRSRPWRRVIWTMRITAPLMVLTCTGFLALSLCPGHSVLAAFQSCLLTFNVALTYFEWCVLKPEWPGRKI